MGTVWFKSRFNWFNFGLVLFGSVLIQFWFNHVVAAGCVWESLLMSGNKQHLNKPK